MFRFIHAADFHLDSPFAALPPREAAARRRESRDLIRELSNYVNQNDIDLVLLAGDLLDNGTPYRETEEALREALAAMDAPVFIAPGNHDPYTVGSPWERQEWPPNVHIFASRSMESVEVPALNAVIHGAAFIGPEQTCRVLEGFSAPPDGRVHIGLLHGEVDAADLRYGAVSRQEIAASGLAYLALGHIHKRGESARYGNTLTAWPGCPEGRGFDETGEKGFYLGTVDDRGAVAVDFVSFARRRYEILTVDVTGQTPRQAVEAAMPPDTAEHLYRILLTGETGEGGAEAAAVQAALAHRFYALEVRDHTRPAEEVWARAGEDSLRGLFLRNLKEKYDAAADGAERETVLQAVRFGLAALDRRDPG